MRRSDRPRFSFLVYPLFASPLFPLFFFPFPFLFSLLFLIFTFFSPTGPGGALAAAVKSTLGPRGRNAVLDKSWGGPTVTKDGVSVAEEVELRDKVAYKKFMVGKEDRLEFGGKVFEAPPMRKRKQD